MNTENQAAKRAFEAAYAMFRVAEHAGNVDIRESLERLAVKILELSATGSLKEIPALIGGVSYILRLGSTVGVIHTENEETIMRALHDLSLEVDILNKREMPPVHLDDILSKEVSGDRHQVVVEDIHKDSGASKKEESMGLKKETVPEYINQNSADIVPSRNPAIRQERELNSLRSSGERQAAIFQKVRQSGTCRLRDIQELLPDVSERTLRYDVEYLIGHGMIERFGSGGPATYYRPKEGLEATRQA